MVGCLTDRVNWLDRPLSCNWAAGRKRDLEDLDQAQWARLLDSVRGMARAAALHLLST
jgi:hypothetical protein